MSSACPQFGFDVVLEATGGADVAAIHVRFVEEVAEPDGLVAEASPAVPGRFTVTRDGGQATHADREAVIAWAAAQPDVARFDLGPLVDLGPSA